MVSEARAGPFRMAKVSVPRVAPQLGKDFDTSSAMVDVDMPVLVLPSIPAILLARVDFFQFCAKNGALVHIMSELYRPLKNSLQKQARDTIQKVTAHNGKMGFNWIQGQYKASVLRSEGTLKGNQYKGAYEAWLGDAATALKAGGAATELINYLAF